MIYSVVTSFVANLIFDIYGISGDNLAYFLVTIVSIILFLISSLFKDKVFKITSLVLTHLTILFVILVCSIIEEYMILFIITTIAFVFNIILSLVFKYKFFNFALYFQFANSSLLIFLKSFTSLS